MDGWMQQQSSQWTALALDTHRKDQLKGETGHTCQGLVTLAGWGQTIRYRYLIAGLERGGSDSHNARQKYLYKDPDLEQRPRMKRKLDLDSTRPRNL